MIQFLRLHARDLDFHATVFKARQFAVATGQSRVRKRVNFIDTRPKSPAQPEWEPLLQGFKEMMAEAFQPLQRALRSQTQGNAPRSAASTPPQSRPATPQLNPPLRGAWQNQQPRNVQGFRGGNTNQSGGTRGGFFQTQGRNNGNNRPQIPPNSPRNQQQFQQRSVTPPVTNRIRRGPGCFVTRRFIGAMVLYRLITVVHCLLGIMNATVEPPLACMPTLASSHRRLAANVSRPRETRVGIRARAIGFRRSSARVQPK